MNPPIKLRIRREREREREILLVVGSCRRRQITCREVAANSELRAKRNLDFRPSVLFRGYTLNTLDLFLQNITILLTNSLTSTASKLFKKLT